MSSQCIRLLVVDDHALLRRAVERILERTPLIEIVGQCENGGRAVSLYAELRPDVTLMDVQMPGPGGIDALKAIRELHAEARILMMTLHPSDSLTQRALMSGAVGCMPKSSLHRHLREAIRVIHGGGTCFPAPRLTEPSTELLRRPSDDE